MRYQFKFLKFDIKCFIIKKLCCFDFASAKIINNEKSVLTA